MTTWRERRALRRAERAHGMNRETRERTNALIRSLDLPTGLLPDYADTEAGHGGQLFHDGLWWTPAEIRAYADQLLALADELDSETQRLAQSPKRSASQAVEAMPPRVDSLLREVRPGPAKA